MDTIYTTADALESAAMPRVVETHTDPDAQDLQAPDAGQTPAPKSAAEWAYRRLILYIQNFEKQLNANEEVAMGFTGGEVGVMRIEGMGFFDPDLITFYGTDQNGVRAQQIQHVSQLNVMLRAFPKAQPEAEPNRIGFRLVKDLEDKADASA